MEDVVVLERQQESLRVVGERPVVDINIDNAPLQFRRILEDRIAQENGVVANE